MPAAAQKAGQPPPFLIFLCGWRRRLGGRHTRQKTLKKGASADLLFMLLQAFNRRQAALCASSGVPPTVPFFQKEGKMPLYISSGEKIFYETVGEAGPWIVLLNGYTRTSSDFKLLAKKLAAENIRVLLIDNRGCGQSTNAGDFTMEDIAADVAAIMGELAIPQATVLGISLGGVIAQCFATLYPQLLAGLVLVSTSRNKHVFEKIRPWPEDLAAATAVFAPMVSSYFRAKNSPLFQALCKNIWQASQSPAFQQGAQAQRSALLRYLSQERDLSPISCPTLILHGEEDAIVPCQEARDMQQALPHAQLHLFAEAGHLLLVEKSTDLFVQLLIFINKM
jgi:pimeloyl-ACP methyl ester carboxylesterase